jgi:hypothetical protein
MLNLSNDETPSQTHARNDHPAHSNAGLNPRRTTMLNRSSILMLIATSMLATTTLIPTSASAKGFGGGGFHAASPNVAATSFNRGAVKTAPVKTAPVQTGNTRSITGVRRNSPNGGSANPTGCTAGANACH